MPQDAYGDNVLAGLKLVNNTTSEERDLPVAGLFYGIGHQPNSGLVAGQVELESTGYVKVGRCRAAMRGSDLLRHAIRRDFSVDSVHSM